MDEYLDIVDEDDQVVGTASRSQIYQKKHIHRIVHVLIFDSQGRLLLQQRSAQNAFLPLHWGTSSGGHVRSGEEYQEAGLRELQEELGVSGEVELVGKSFYIDTLQEGLRKYITVFKMNSDGPFTTDPAEGEMTAFFTLPEIQQKLDQGEKFMPELTFVLKKYFNIT